MPLISEQLFPFLFLFLSLFIYLGEGEGLLPEAGLELTNREIVT